MESNEVIYFQHIVHNDLYQFLLRKRAIDEHLPKCPDVEDKWSEVAESYLPDGIREFQKYPIVSLGWMMFIGMAMAYYWDADWSKISDRTDIYEMIRDKNGYDYLDDTVVNDILGYEGEKGERVQNSVAECASRVYTMLTHNHIEPGTETAFHCYVVALQEMYLMGMAVELNALGYHMTAFNPSDN